MVLYCPENYFLTHFSPMAHTEPLSFFTGTSVKFCFPNSEFVNLTGTYFISYDASVPGKLWNLM